MNEQANQAAMPIEQYITVTTGKEDNHLLNCVVHEYQGFEIYLVSNEMDDLFTVFQLEDSRRWPRNPHTLKPLFQKVITNKDQLKVGMKVLVKGLLDYEWIVATIKQWTDSGKLYADLGGCVGFLKFEEDNRGCWVCTCLVNKRCFEMNLPSCIKTGDKNS